MENPPSTESHENPTESPEPEVLNPRSDNDVQQVEAAAPTTPPPKPEDKQKARHRTYRPSHKATFIGLAVVVVILAINAGILSFLLRSKGSTNNLANAGQVTISQAALSKIGVNSSTLGNSGIVLTVDPNAEFQSNVTVGGSVTIAGGLKLNSTFTANSANLAQLQAGNTSLSQLAVNGSTTLSSLALRTNLTVNGTSQLQGVVTIDNDLAVSGNLTVGGSLSTISFSARSLTSTGTLTIGGHILTSGSTPGLSGGSALGSNGTLSISGNDSAGTVSLGIGAFASAGTLANIAFKTKYADIPRVVATLEGAVSAACSIYTSNITVSGFSVGDYCVSNIGGTLTASGLPAGGYSIDYIVEQ
jgi:hypothetical protein